MTFSFAHISLCSHAGVELNFILPPPKSGQDSKEKANMEDNMEVLARPFQFESEICLIWISALKVELKLGKTCCL